MLRSFTIIKMLNYSNKTLYMQCSNASSPVILAKRTDECILSAKLALRMHSQRLA